MEEQLKEMLGKRPDELEGETLKLFEAIMKIADERDKLKTENEELEKEMTDFRDCWLHKDKIREKIEELEDKIQENTDEQGYWGSSDYETQIDILQELLED